MKRNRASILGFYEHLDATVEALEGLREAGHRDLTVLSPMPRHELEEALESHGSPVRFFTLVGGLLGCISGFALTIWTSLDWPLRTSAKPIVSIPPFVIIAFEMTILLGALGTLLGLFLSARLPSLRGRIPYDSRFSEGHFGIAVRCSEDQIEAVQKVLKGSGAEEVHIERS